MCQAMDEIFYVYDHADELIKEAQDKADKAEKAAKETYLDTLYHDIKHVMEGVGISLAQTMNILKVSDSDRAILMERFN